MKGLKESFRKLLVSLKRRPHMIPLLVFAFLIWLVRVIFSANVLVMDAKTLDAIANRLQ